MVLTSQLTTSRTACSPAKLCLCTIVDVYFNNIPASFSSPLCTPEKNCLCLDRRPTKCHPCAPGSYSPHVDHDGNCSLCPGNSTSLPAISVREQCMCKRGYYGADVEDCTICPVGKYKDQVGSHVCTPCPNNSHTYSSGSQKFSDCVCDPGYTGVNASVCRQCEPDTFKEYRGTLGQGCDTCPNHTQSPAGSDHITDCVCNPAYFALEAGIACWQCPEYNWKNLAGSVKCNPCPANSRSYAGSLNITNCTCISGHVGPADGQSCTPCSPGTYKQSGGTALCAQCPNHMTSPAGSYYIEECNCNAGFFGENGDVCIPCSAGKYKDRTGSDDCSHCFDYSSSPPGSNSSYQCVCMNGFEELLAGVSCQDIDECALGVHDCSPFEALCTNTLGSFSCTCKTQWYSGNGTSCRPESWAVQVAYFVFLDSDLVPVASAYTSAFAVFLEIEEQDVTVSLQEVSAPQNSSWRRLLETPAESGNASNWTLLVFTAHVTADEIQHAVNASNDLAAFNLLLSSRGLPAISRIHKSGRLVAECGNGLLDATETCDDGNTLNNDGCSSVCHIERGWKCEPNTHFTIGKNLSASSCVDINECAECSLLDAVSPTTSSQGIQPCSPIAQCSALASCINLAGSFLCACAPGFFGNGLECADDLSNNNTLQRDTIFSPEPVQVLRATAAETAAMPNFGIAVSLSRDSALIGSEGSSKTQLFERGLEREWRQDAAHSFSCPPVSATDTNPPLFGTSVALHMTAISSKMQDRLSQRASCAAMGSSHGVVYIFHKEPNAKWADTPAAILQAPDNDEIFFGASLALNADELLVGAPGSNLALIFRRPPRNKYGVTQDWPSQPDFRLDGHRDIQMLGQAVALSDSHAAVSSHSSGIVVAFQRHADGSWPTRGSVLHPAVQPSDEGRLHPSLFGTALSLSTSFLVVGDPAWRAVSVFKISSLFSTATTNASSTARWVLRQRDGGLFGDCVASTDLYLVVGARGANRAFLFKSYRNNTWPLLPVQELTYGAQYDASSVGAACVINNQDMLLPSFSHSRGHVFVHSSACQLGFYGLSSDHCLKCPDGTSSVNVSRTITGCICCDIITM
jgi:cysteine-rich repeat protein